MSSYQILKAYFDRKEWFVAQWQGEVFGQPCSGEDAFYIIEMNGNLIEIVSLTQAIKWCLGIYHDLRKKWVDINQLAMVRSKSSDYIPSSISLLIDSPDQSIEKMVAEGVRQGAVAISNDGISSRIMPVNDPKFLRELALACKKYGVPLCLEEPDQT